ncbi:MAG TPA: HAD-IIA family hydrolase [Limnochordales bacterium]|nr:HAD-IIA family hydrolase [Limnochordales bacterium]
MRRLTDYQGYIFDLDGTIYLGERLIDGARETVLGLRAAGKRVVFLSNKPLETRDDYARKLTRLGIPTPAEEVINSSWVMARWLAAEAPGATVYVIGEPPLLDELRRAGLHVVEDPSGRYHEVRFVIAAFDRTFHYQKLNHALQAIRRGARFVATNSDRTCPVEDGEIPDAAGVIGAIEGVTGRPVELITGKPYPIMVETILRHLGLPASDCLMVGDRLETDMLMGVRAGMGTALVLTGVTRREQLPHPEIRPDFVLDSVAAIAHALAEDT